MVRVADVKVTSEVVVGGMKPALFSSAYISQTSLLIVYKAFLLLLVRFYKHQNKTQKFLTL